MAVLMPAKSADFEPPPEGSHVGVCYRVIDLGTQETTFQGAASKKHLLMLSWELSEEKMSDGRPFTISKRYTYSSSPKSNLRKDLESWRGKRFEDKELGAFDIGRLLGVGCMLNVVHSEKNESLYANVAAIMRMPRGMSTPPLTNETVSFSLQERPFDRASFDRLGERLQDTIRKAPEYQRAIGALPEHEEEEPPLPESDDLDAWLSDRGP